MLNRRHSYHPAHCPRPVLPPSSRPWRLETLVRTLRVAELWEGKATCLSLIQMSTVLMCCWPSFLGGVSHESPLRTMQGHASFPANQAWWWGRYQQQPPMMFRELRDLGLGPFPPSPLKSSRLEAHGATVAGRVTSESATAARIPPRPESGGRGAVGPCWDTLSLLNTWVHNAQHEAMTNVMGRHRKAPQHETVKETTKARLFGSRKRPRSRWARLHRNRNQEGKWARRL